MRTFLTEFRKLFSNRIFLLIISAVLILNAYLMFKTANSGDVTPSDYKQIYTELENKTDKEKLSWLENQMNDFSQEPVYNREAISELYHECNDIVTYKEYLNAIDSQAKSMTSISIFANPDTFNYRSIIKTPPAYRNVRNVEPVFDVSKGLNLALDNSFTNIFCGFILLFAVLSLMISDREQGMSGLLFSLKRGRGYLFSVKLAALAVVAFCTVILLYSENLIISAYLYGLGDLSRPIQSLNGFIGCNLKLNVASYLVVFALFQFAALFSICAVLSLIAVITKNTISFYSISAAVMIAEGFLYSFVDSLSVYSIFRYINLIAFTKVNAIFFNYRNINFWEYPISLLPASLAAVIFIAVICSVFSALLYAKKRNLEFRKVGLNRNLGKGTKVHSAMYYAFYKSLIQQKGILILVLFFLIAGFTNSVFQKQYDIQDVYYKYYCSELEGGIDESAETYMQAEKMRFEDLHTQLDKITEQTNGFSAEAYEIQKQLVPESGFVLFQNRVEQIKDLEDAEIFYDTGYRRMFGKMGYDDDMRYALPAILLCVFLISPIIANDNRYRMQAVIHATASGKRKYLKRSMILSMTYGLLSAWIWNISYMVKINQFYGFRGLSAPIQSIADFTRFPIILKVWQYIGIVFILRTVFIIFAAWMMLWISAKCKNTTIALLVNFAVFALPIIVYILGADIMINIGANPFLSVNALFNNFSLIQIFLPIVVMCLTAFNCLKNLQY